MISSTADSKQFVGKYLQALSGQQKTPDLVARFVTDLALAEHIAQVEEAFPAYELIAEHIVAERDLVAVHATFQGVHRGVFAGIAPTGRSVSAGLMIMYRVEGDRIVEHWMQFDGPALMRQLAQ